MHHKRGRPKNARAGCLLCHGYKQNGLSVRKRTAPGLFRTLQEPVADLVAETFAEAQSRWDEEFWCSCSIRVP